MLFCQIPLPPETIQTLADNAPYLVCLLILVFGFLYFLKKNNESREKQETERMSQFRGLMRESHENASQMTEKMSIVIERNSRALGRCQTVIESNISLTNLISERMQNMKSGERKSEYKKEE